MGFGFDLYWALTHKPIDIGKVIECYKTYMEFSVEIAPSRKQFLTNMEKKMKDKEFLQDIPGILKPEARYNESAWETIKNGIIEKI